MSTVWPSNVPFEDFDVQVSMSRTSNGAQVRSLIARGGMQTRTRVTCTTNACADAAAAPLARQLLNVQREL